ncbi:MAG: hypothetical protein KC468_27020 [Myxococcales bacterium]|nr:hypothetical protein [Myxococcales bacterium]
MDAEDWALAAGMSFWDRYERVMERKEQRWPVEAVPWLLEGLRMSYESGDDWSVSDFFEALEHAPATPESVATLLVAIFESSHRNIAYSALIAQAAGHIEFWALVEPIPFLAGSLPCDGDAIAAALPEDALELRAMLAPFAPSVRPALEAALRGDDLHEKELAARGLKPAPDEVDLSDVLANISGELKIPRLGALGVHALARLPWLSELAGDGYEDRTVRARASAASDAIVKDCRRFVPWLRAQLREALARPDSRRCYQLSWALGQIVPGQSRRLGELRFNRRGELEVARMILEAMETAEAAGG